MLGIKEDPYLYITAIISSEEQQNDRKRLRSTTGKKKTKSVIPYVSDSRS